MNNQVLVIFDEEKQYAWSIAYTNNDGNTDADRVL